MDRVFLLPMIALALWVFGGIAMIYQSCRRDLDRLWAIHEARYLAKGVRVERTPEWERSIRFWMRVQLWLGISIIILCSLVPLYFYLIS